MSKKCLEKKSRCLLYVFYLLEIMFYSLLEYIKRKVLTLLICTILKLAEDQLIGQIFVAGKEYATVYIIKRTTQHAKVNLT